MENSIPVQLANQRLIIKRQEIEVLKAEAEILLITRDIEQDMERYKKASSTMSEDDKERHEWTIAVRYCDIEKYKCYVRFYQRRVESERDKLKMIICQPTP
jgi:hypothetical protein